MKQLLILTVTLLVLLGCSDSDGYSTSSANTSDASSKSVALEKPAKSWYVRLVAEAIDRKLITYSSQLGMLDEVDAARSQSLSHYPPRTPYVDIQFVDPIELENGSYKSYFKEYLEGEESSWTFTVCSDDPNANIVLSWRGLYVATPYETDLGERRYKEYISRQNPILKFMQVVDETTGEVTPIIIDHKLQSIAFNMNGSKERTFRWELLTEEVSIKKAPTRRSVSFRSSESVAPVSTPAEFDMNVPPSFNPRKK